MQSLKNLHLSGLQRKNCKKCCQPKVLEKIDNMNKAITSSKTVSFNGLVQRFQVQYSWIFQLVLIIPFNFTVKSSFSKK